MTIQELINELEKYPKDEEIYIYKESTNYYSPDSTDWITKVYQNEYGEIVIK